MRLSISFQKLIQLLVFVLIAIEINAQCDIPPVGYSFVEGTSDYVIINPDSNNPMEVTTCAMQFMGNPFIPDANGSSFDPGTGLYYVFQGSDLYAIDTELGCDVDNVTLIGPTGITNPIVGSDIKFANGMATIYVVDSGNPQTLYEIDPTTGLILSQVAISGASVLINGGLTIDQTTCTLYGTLTGANVYQIDLNGNASFCFFFPSDGGDGFSIGSDGLAYYESESDNTIYSFPFPPFCGAQMVTSTAVATYTTIAGELTTLAFNGSACEQDCPDILCDVTETSPVSCIDRDDGAAFANPTGGVAPYTFEWDNGETGQAAIALTIGPHTVTITDVNDCSVVCDVTITGPPALSCTVELGNNISCFGQNDGSATVNIVGGTPGFTILWSTGESGSSAESLVPGDNSVTVTDSNGCMTECSIEIEEPDQLTCEINLDSNISCLGEVDGSATIVATGGEPPYTYAWDNGEMTQTAVGLSAGAHVGSVTDANDCISTCTVTIIEPMELTCTTNVLMNVLCAGDMDGSAEAIPAGGTSPFTYLWDNGETTQIAVMLTGGSHVVTVTDAAGCDTTCMVDIMDVSGFTCSATSDSDISCFGADDGVATVTGMGGVPGYTFEWDNGQTTATATGLTPGTHNVTATDMNGCETICDVFITEPAELTCMIGSVTDLICFEQNDGSATVTPEGGTGPYTFLWDNGQTTQTATGLDAGETIVVVTDANDCETSCMIIIDTPTELLCAVTLVNDVLCFGQNDGSATAVPQGGTAPYTYLWDNGQNTATAINLTPTTHAVTVFDANLCETRCIIDIMEPALLTCSVNLISNILCAGDTNGSAVAIPMGGTAPYTYEWDTGETADTAMMLGFGLRTVMVTDANGCMTSCTVEITDVSGLECDIIVNSNVSCTGFSDGSATVTATGGSPGYTYEWDNGETTPTAMALNAGLHSVTVEDMNGCETICSITITERPQLTCNVELVNDLTCFSINDGSATAVPAGGLPDYTFAWDNGQTTATATGLTPGLHEVTVTDANNCFVICDIVIDSPPELTCMTSLVNDITCFGFDDGSATVTAGGGTPGYTYRWDNGQTTQTATGLTPGTHMVTVIDNNLCEVICDIDIAEPAEFICSTALINNILCAGDSNGSAEAMPTGGTAPYTYLWDSGETTATAMMLGIGERAVTVTDANDCIAICVVEIMNVSGLTCLVTLENNVSCNGLSDGSATANPTGGTSPYTYEWDNGEVTQTAVGLNAGFHDVTVTDANNCETICDITITEPQVLACMTTLVNDISCFGEDDGSATANPTGGTAPYTYEWDNGQTTATATGLTPGPHTVMVTDANMCTTTCDITIDEPTELTCMTSVVNDITCFGDDDGSATVTAGGGTPGYTYLWDNGQTTETATGLTPGPHTVIVSDENLCRVECEVIIGEPAQLVCSTTLINNILCAGDINGSAEAIPVGGTAPYTYEWDNGETTAIATMLSFGRRTVSVTDANGCETECFIDILDVSALTCLVTPENNVSCNGLSDGSATVNPTGGTEPYTYAWDNGEVTQTAVGLNAGFHDVTVTDANDCVTICDITITEPPILTCLATLENDISCFGADDGSASANPEGGTPGYTYLWDDGQTTAVAVGLTPGLHVVDVTDANGCTTSCDITIFEPTQLTCTIETDNDISCFGADDGTATITAVGGTPGYSYIWSDGQTSATATGLTPGMHTATVTDLNDCITICDVTIAEPIEFICDVTLLNDVLCAGNTDGRATANVTSGGIAPFEYLWDNGETTQTAVALTAGNHDVTVTDATDCIAICNIFIDDQSVLECLITLENNVVCFGESNGSATANTTGGNPPYTYEWDNGEITATATQLNAGIHTVTVNDGNGCGSTCIIEITQPDLLECTVSLGNDISCNGFDDGSAAVASIGGTVPYTYLWDDGQTTAAAVNLTPGLHFVTTTDANGCEIVCDITIVEPPELTCEISLDNNISCFGADDGAATITANGGIPGYTYLWDDGQTTAAAVGLTPGLHTATVTDANNCTTFCDVTIAEPIQFICEATLVNDVLCAGDVNGSAMASVTSGGIAPFTYLWDNGETTQTAEGLTAGNHTVTISDATNCITVCGIIILDQSILECALTLENPVSCFGGNDGSATATAVGGVPPFTFLWDNGETTATATMLDAGVHSVLVNDDNGCGTTCTIAIPEPPEYSCQLILEQNISCFGANDGSATVITTGGTPGYTYLWDDGQTTATAINLTPGLHTVTTMDANGCPIVCEINIFEPTQLLCTIALVNDISCFGANDGAATITASEGTPGYTYLWDDGQTTAAAVGLTPGLHTATVTDQNNCESTCTITIEEPIEFLCDVVLENDVSCAGDVDGSATANVSMGGLAPFTYLWDNGEVTQTAVGLTSGNHTVTISDATNCITVCSIIIMDQSELSCTVSLESAVSCFGGDNGSATVVAAGGTGQYTYMWDNGETTATATMLSAGIHTVIINDSNNCGRSCTIDIPEPPEYSCSVTLVSDISCFGANDGSATASATGGTPGYTYLWDNGETTALAVSLSPGLHTVTATDANGCPTICDVTIGEPDQLLCTVEPVNEVSCFGANDGVATAIPTGGTPGYTYLWDDGQTTPTAIGLTPGPHSVTITDMNDCTTSCGIEILEPVEFTCTTALINDVFCAGDRDGSAEVLTSGGIAPFSFQWDNGEAVAIATMLSGGMHFVTVTDATGCQTICDIFIDDQSDLDCTVDVVSNISCADANDGIAIVNATGGVPGYTYLWDNGDTTQTATQLPPGLIQVTVTDMNGCGTICTVTITEPFALDLSEPIETTTVTCMGSNIDGRATVTVGGGTMPYSYAWPNGESTQTAVNLPVGAGNVTITDSNGCQIDRPYLISLPEIPTISFENVLPISCDSFFDGTQNDGEATAVVAGGNPGYSYQWSNGETTPTAVALTPGQNFVTVTDAFGCSSVAELEVQFDACGGLELDKIGFLDDPDARPVPGALVNYTFVVCNTGTVELNVITVTDTLANVTGGPISLQPGTCDSTSFVGTYILQQVDIDRRMVENQANASGDDGGLIPVTAASNDPATLADDDPTIIILKSPEISLEKVADVSGLQNPPQPGDIIAYNFTVCNIGDLELTNIQVIDNGINLGTSTISSLLPGACDSTTVTGTYAINSTDIVREFFENSATVTSEDPDGDVISDFSDDPNDPTNQDFNRDGNPDDPTVVSLDPLRQIELVKTGNVPVECPNVGDPIIYTFEICNTGNVDLRNVNLSDAKVTLPSFNIAILEAGECDTLLGTYPLTQDDINIGGVQNSANVSSFDINGIPVLGSDNITTPVVQKPLVEIVKTGAFNDESGDNIAQVGETLAYNFKVTNIGNVTLTNLIVSDPLITVTGAAIPILQPTESDSITYEGIYTITDADLENGFVTNTATVASLDPNQQIITSDTTEVVEYNVRQCDELVCNNDLQISLGQDCFLLLNKDILLEDPAYGVFEIEIFDADTLFSEGFLDERSINKTLKYQVTCASNSCWGTLSVEANAIPVFDAPCAVGPNGEINPECTFGCLEAPPKQIITVEEALEILDSPCNPDLIGDLIVNETRENEICDPNGEVITITYSGKFLQHDVIQTYDLLTQQYISTARTIDEIKFPDDVVVNCAIDNPTPELILALDPLVSPLSVFPVLRDNNIDFIPDSILVCPDSTVLEEIIIGTKDTIITTIIDGREVYTVLTEVIKEQRLGVDSANCEIVVDEESLDLLDFIPITDRFCNILVSYDDVSLATCGVGRKILRTWRIIDWCNSSLERSGIQTVELRDDQPPEIQNEFVPQEVYVEPWSCVATYQLPFITVSENCNSTEISFISDEGTVVNNEYITDLWYSETPVTVIVRATDECGNSSDGFISLIVKDVTAPVVVCNVSAQVVLTGGSSAENATLFAKDIDEGSHDAGCGRVELSIVRLEDYSEGVFNCEGDTLGFLPKSCHALVDTIRSAEFYNEGKNVECADSLNVFTKAGDYIKFCCEDAGKLIDVLLIATDKHGNSNRCVVQVLVQDKSRPYLDCQAVEVECNEEVATIIPEVLGGICGGHQYEVQLLSESSLEVGCSNGVVTREWYLDFDESGDLSLDDAYCEQRITFEDGVILDPKSIKWPKNYDGNSLLGVNRECSEDSTVVETDAFIDMGTAMECLVSDEELQPIWCQSDCSIVGLSLKVDTISTSTACLSIIKRWTIVDWCTWSPDQANRDDENDGPADQFEAVEDWAQGSCEDCINSSQPVENVYFRYSYVDPDGYYTFDQIIRISDNTAPEIDAPATFVVSTSRTDVDKDSDEKCIGSADITVSADDSCGELTADISKLTWRVTVLIDDEEVASKTGKGPTMTMNSEEGSPGDIHIIRWLVQDACGNYTTAETEVAFGDEINPTPVCVSALTTSFNEAGQIIIWGSEFDAGSFDNCSPTEDLKFSVVSAGDTAARPDEEGFDDQLSIQLDCRFVSEFTELDAWVWDNNGNGDFCRVSINLNGDCDESQVNQGVVGRVSGQVLTSDGLPVEDVRITLDATLSEYPKTFMTTDRGLYFFNDNPEDYNYKLEATKNQDHDNGLSTSDLVHMQKHILEIIHLDSPYKVIAADANGDGVVSAADLLDIRKIILGLQNEFNNNQSWRFVDESQSFFDELNPWPFIEVLNILNLIDGEVDKNFVAVKIGDVNLTANPGNSLRTLEKRSSDRLEISTTNRFIRKGETIEVEFRGQNLTDVFGFQYTLEHKGLIAKEIVSSKLNISPNQYALFEESLTMSWNEAERISTEGVMFTVIFESTKDQLLSESLRLNSAITKAEAYIEDADYVSDLILRIEDETSSFELHQNTPNPFSDQTIIGFTLDADSDIIFKFFDLSGKVLKELSLTYAKGYHELQISKDQLSTTGVVYYQLLNKDNIQTRKMILLD